MRLSKRSLMKLAEHFHVRVIEMRKSGRQLMSVGLEVNCERLVDQRRQLAAGSANVALAKPPESPLALNKPA